LPSLSPSDVLVFEEGPPAFAGGPLHIAETGVRFFEVAHGGAPIILFGGNPMRTFITSAFTLDSNNLAAIVELQASLIHLAAAFAAEVAAKGILGDREDGAVFLKVHPMTSQDPPHVKSLLCHLDVGITGIEPSAFSVLDQNGAHASSAIALFTFSEQIWVRPNDKFSTHGEDGDDSEWLGIPEMTQVLIDGLRSHR
jgi:hypothetical protein